MNDREAILARLQAERETVMPSWHVSGSERDEGVGEAVLDEINRRVKAYGSTTYGTPEWDRRVLLRELRRLQLRELRRAHRHKARQPEEETR